MSRATRAALLLVLVLVVAAVPRAASAQSVYAVNVCLTIQTNFSDRLGGDYWLANADVIARGMWLEVDEYENGTYRGVIFHGYVDDVTGCKSVQLWSHRDYKILGRSKASVNGVPIEVDVSAANPTQYTWIWFTAFRPAGPSPLTIAAPANTATAQLAVAMFTMHKNNAGLGASLPLKFDNTAVCCNGSDQEFIRAATQSKFVLAHETGHGIGRRRDGNANPVRDYSAATNNCDGERLVTHEHTTTSREWYSAAIKEGFADFVAAWVWNDYTDSSCTYDRQYGSDFDLSGGFDAPTGLADCEGVPATGLASYVSGDDWLEDLVNAADPLGCSGSLTHHSTEFDFLRFGWDLVTDQAVPYSAVVDIYDNADPRAWSATYDVLSGEDARTNWFWASYNLGYGAEYAAEYHNGLDH